MRLLHSICLTALIFSALPAFSMEPIDAAEVFAAECSQCHGRAARGMASFPSLRGQTAEYLTDRLHSYRASEAVGPNSMLMYPVAQALSDETIESLTTYIYENFN